MVNEASQVPGNGCPSVAVCVVQNRPLRARGRPTWRANSYQEPLHAAESLLNDRPPTPPTCKLTTAVVKPHHDLEDLLQLNRRFHKAGLPRPRPELSSPHAAPLTMSLHALPCKPSAWIRRWRRQDDAQRGGDFLGSATKACRDTQLGRIHLPKHLSVECSCNRAQLICHAMSNHSDPSAELMCFFFSTISPKMSHSRPRCVNSVAALREPAESRSSQFPKA